MNIKALRQSLKTLRQSLAALHRKLLNYQLQIQENLDERRYSQGDLLQLSIHSPDFEWLRPLSVLIAAIDETADEELIEEVLELRDQVLQKATGWLTPLDLEEGSPAASTATGFAKRLHHATTRDPMLTLEIASTRRALADLGAAV